MWELISKLIPAPVLVGILIWGLISAIWLQPIVEERRANITYIPQCRAGELPAIQATRNTRQPAPTQNQAPSEITDDLGSVTTPPETLQPPVSVQIISELRSLFREDDTAYTAFRYGSEDSCGCAVGTAYDRSFWASLGNVMLLGFFTPRSIKFLEVQIARIKASGICG